MKKAILLILLVGTILIILKVVGDLGLEKLFWGGNYELYSDLSFINGINTTRGYGLIKGLNPLIAKILFNKSLYVWLYLLRICTASFNAILSILRFIVFYV